MSVHRSTSCIQSGRRSGAAPVWKLLLAELSSKPGPGKEYSLLFPVVLTVAVTPSLPMVGNISF